MRDDDLADLTFADLGIPFPLFEAPVRETSDYAGQGTCDLCDATAAHCFRLAIGVKVLVECGCGAVVALEADDRASATCAACNTPHPFPSVGGAEPLACYDCLRAGKVCRSQDTELGLVTEESVASGWTHGVPGLENDDFELRLTPKNGEDEEWRQAKVPTEHLRELSRTPTYTTWQGERWLFCCKRPMVYLGSWSAEDFEVHALDGDGRALFDEVVEHPGHGLWEGEMHDCTGIYVFHCAICERKRAHWDIA